MSSPPPSSSSTKDLSFPSKMTNNNMEVIPPKKQNKNAMGVLCTGWLEKNNPEKYFSSKNESKTRFVVLTHVALHWFKREKGYDLFGEETGQMQVSDISKVIYHEEDDEVIATKNGRRNSDSSEQKNKNENKCLSFEITSKGLSRRIFRASSAKECELWVNQINYAIRSRRLYRRLTISGIAMEGDYDDSNTEIENIQPSILAITLEKFRNPAENTFKDSNSSSIEGSLNSPLVEPFSNEKEEIVLGKHLKYADSVKIANLHSKDTINVLFSTGDSSAIKGYQLLNSTNTQLSTETLSIPTAKHTGNIMVAAAASAASTASFSNDQKNTNGVEKNVKKMRMFQITLFIMILTIALSYYMLLFDQDLTMQQEPNNSNNSQIQHMSDDNQCIMQSKRESLLLSMVDDTKNSSSFSKFCMASKIILDSLILILLTRLSIVNLNNDINSKKPSNGNGIQAGRNPKHENLKVGDIQISIDEFNFIPKEESFADGAGMVSSNDTMGLDNEDDNFTDDEIPQRFVVGCFHDMVEARRRWAITKKWRREFGADTMLDEESIHYDAIKELLPHFYCMSGRDGNPVYYERSGQCDIKRAKDIGIDAMTWHYVHTTEFIYQKMYTSEDHKTITVFDVSGVGLKDLAGEPIEFIRKCINIMQDHYPERARVCLIVNAPSWFELVWQLIKPFINEVTRKKIKIVSSRNTFECISEFVAPENIPQEYGGTLVCGDGGKDNARWNSPEEVAYRNHVYATNEKYAQQRLIKEENIKKNETKTSE